MYIFAAQSSEMIIFVGILVFCSLISSLSFLPQLSLITFVKPLFHSKPLRVPSSTTTWHMYLDYLSHALEWESKLLVLTKLVLEVALEPHLKTLWEGTSAPSTEYQVLFVQHCLNFGYGQLFPFWVHSTKNSSLMKGLWGL